MNNLLYRSRFCDGSKLHSIIFGLIVCLNIFRQAVFSITSAQQVHDLVTKYAKTDQFLQLPYKQVKPIIKTSGHGHTRQVDASGSDGYAILLCFIIN